MNRQPHPAFATSQESLRNKPGEIVWNQRVVTRAVQLRKQLEQKLACGPCVEELPFACPSEFLWYHIS